MSGARSKIGKTQLSRALSDLLEGSVRIKIGHHPRKPGGDPNLYPMGTSFSTIAAEHGDASFLIIESNRILEEITPDCAIYLTADDPKPSAAFAGSKADIIRGEPISCSKISSIARRIDLDETVVRKIAELSGALPG